ncbi:MAG TPA: phosphatidate cytidylyltransferase [Bacillota bacterium]|nr:phosphatidate cytidylyltransferase [Bacillota bacterium]HOK68751.1 phosphatidate cytidylyltransferase [Bacillota bacterium]HPP85604.1 phosphatidate cytidylyltransferase [Bacillota bacterium]
MGKRILTGVVALFLLVPVLYFSETMAFPVIFGVLAAIAVYEFANCAGFKGARALVALPLILTAAAMPPLARSSNNQQWLVLICLGVFIYLIFVAVFGYGKINVTDISALFFGFVYTAVAFSLLVVVRDSAPERYLLVFIAAWSTDTFAYFGGYLFGNRKLCPNLSPKKTVAGAIAGVVGAVASFMVFGLIVVGQGGSFDFAKYCAYAVIASVASQTGDLAASAIKRHYGVKDYGNLFPGHGGVLDRFDSILFLTVGAYILLTVLH